MSFIKKKTKKSLIKRFRGKKMKHFHAYTSHLAYSKSTKRKRHLKKGNFLNITDLKRLKKVIYWKNL